MLLLVVLPSPRRRCVHVGVNYRARVCDGAWGKGGGAATPRNDEGCVGPLVRVSFWACVLGEAGLEDVSLLFSAFDYRTVTQSQFQIITAALVHQTPEVRRCRDRVGT